MINHDPSKKGHQLAAAIQSLSAGASGGGDGMAAFFQQRKQDEAQVFIARAKHAMREILSALEEDDYEESRRLIFEALGESDPSATPASPTTGEECRAEEWQCCGRDASLGHCCGQYEPVYIEKPDATPQPEAAQGGDFARGIAFIVRNKDQLLKVCAGPSESYVVDQTIEALAATPQPQEAPAQECGANGAGGCSYRPCGPIGESQCQFCGAPPAHGDGEVRIGATRCYGDDAWFRELTVQGVTFLAPLDDQDRARHVLARPTPEAQAARDAALSLVERKLRKLPKQWRSHIGPGPATREIKRADGDTDYCNDNAIWAETAMAIENFLHDFDAALALPAQGRRGIVAKTKEKFSVTLAPFAAVYAGMHEMMRNLTDDELIQLVDACGEVSQTNCWWGTFQVAQIIKPEAVTELRQRGNPAPEDSP